MFLAPLNYDRFFKKVFSDITIAKTFLESVLGKTIDEIFPYERKNKITDRAVGVKFDFRCKIAGKSVIIEMQQWYKTDIIKRFYLYHSLQSVLQLENIKQKTIPVCDDGSLKKAKGTINYDELQPVISLIWMVSDNLGCKDDVVSFVLSPETLRTFLIHEAWEKNAIEELVQERKKIMELINNDTKGMQFLSENRLMFLFQQNIVKHSLHRAENQTEENNRKPQSFDKWFRFAQLTLNEDNTR